jgi:hypothetical protein
MTRDQAIVVMCLRCKHRGVVSEQNLSSYGVKPNSPIASFVKRLRCTRCGSRSVMVSRQPKKQSA